MIWPLISAFVYTVNKRVDRVNIFENYIQLVVVILAFPSLMGFSGEAMQVVALIVLVYFLRIWPKKNREAEQE
jgi:hypothetical protein